MINVAILGYGTVGSGVVEVLKTNQDSIDKRAGKKINVKYVLDLRDFEGDPVQKLITHNIEDILGDEDIKVIVEVMGGVEPAYTFVKRALLAGKSVVTSNKELVAKHGAELLKIARKNEINFLFEASVGGGIPIIRPLNKSLTADEITDIKGILNGTTNFILSKMVEEDLDFETVLKQAQEKGYAEKNPEADIEGHDACRKIAILSSLAFGMHVNYEEIYTEGITHITKEDIKYAKKLNCHIKLLAESKKIKNHVYAYVAPTMINEKHPLANVNGVFNAIYVNGNVIGDVMFYGSGAGKLPTASAVVADVVDAVKHLDRNIITFWSTKEMDLINIAEVSAKVFLRIAYNDQEKAKSKVEQILGIEKIVELDNVNGEFGIVSNEWTQGEIQEKITTLKQSESIRKVYNEIKWEY